MPTPEILDAFQAKLREMGSRWKVKNGSLAGKKGATLRITRGDHSDSPRHLDLCFEFRVGKSEPFELRDCVTGFGESDMEIGQSAAHIWASTTATAWLELQYSGRGKYATHFRGNDPEGLTGWHMIAGNYIAYGNGTSAEQLKQWWGENPFFDVLAGALGDSLIDDGAAKGIKILMGAESSADVSINGEHHEAASKALLELPWPRLNPPAIIRSYIIALHRD